MPAWECAANPSGADTPVNAGRPGRTYFSRWALRDNLRPDDDDPAVIPVERTRAHRQQRRRSAGCRVDSVAIVSEWSSSDAKLVEMLVPWQERFRRIISDPSHLALALLIGALVGSTIVAFLACTDWTHALART